MAEIKQRITLDGAEDVAAKLKKVGDAGEDAFTKLDKHAARGGESFQKFSRDIEGSGGREAGEKLREALHALHPVLDEAGLGLEGLGGFARLAGAGMGVFGAAVVGTALVALAKLSEETAKAKQRFGDLARSPEAGEQLYKGLQKNADATGTAVKGAGGYVENLLRLREKLEAKGGISRVAGAPVKTGPLNDQSIEAAERVLTQRGIIGGLTADKAKEQAGNIGQSLLQHGGLSTELLDQTSQASPGLANYLAELFGGKGETHERFKLDIQKGRFRNLDADEINRRLAAQQGPTQKEFDARPKHFSDTLEEMSRNRERVTEAILEGPEEARKNLVGRGGPLRDPYAPPLSPANTGFRQPEIQPDLGGSEIRSDGKGPIVEGLDKQTSVLEQILGAILGKGVAETSKSANERVPEEFNQLRPKSAGAESQVRSPTNLKSAPEIEAPTSAPTSLGPDQSQGKPAHLISATPVGPIVPKFNEDGSVNPYGGLPNNRPHPNDGFTNPFGQAPHNEAERRQQLHESAAVDKQAAEDQRLFSRNIRDQNGGNHPSLDRNNYAPPVLGHYDFDQKFIASPKQPARDPNAVPGAPYPTKFPAYDRALTKEFQDKYGPSMNPPGVENPFTAPPTVQPAPGNNPGDGPLIRVPINGPDQQPGFASGGYISFDDGGHVRGPGTGTSDSIPALLSDGEYVVKASSVAKLGKGYLDHLNAGRYADGGQVQTPAPLLGSLSIVYDPISHGAYINGVLHRPGDPILNDPRVKKGIEQSKKSVDDGSSDTPSGIANAKKDWFVGDYGEGRGFAEGGYIRRFANGGLVGSSSAISRLWSVPRFADGGYFDAGLTSFAPAPSAVLSGADIDNLAPPPGGSPSSLSETPHFGTLDLTTQFGSGRVTGPQELMRQLGIYAQGQAMVQTGPAPSWATR